MPKMKQADVLREGLKAPPGPDNPRCNKCKLHVASYTPFIEPKIDGNVVFVLPSPSLTEYELGQGYEWKIVKTICEAAGLERDMVSLATVTRCAPINKKTMGKTARTMCQPFLLRALNDLTEEKKLIAMGADVAKSLLGEHVDFDDVVGRVFETVHGAVLITYSAREYFHEVRKGVINVGILEAIILHVKRYVEDTSWYTFRTLEVV